MRVRLPWRRAKEFQRQGVKCIEREWEKGESDYVT